ncbi:MAG TPA: prepilin-type N-terminal cleavage/methylation domain-containing protein [Verrucomicrobiae bacterium]|nr:prepilin-type N-terminal cleavage/methylation domain-containing protein [Verrucomicrobiae bacterium]
MKEATPSRNARGFSLVELMVAMAIFLIICAAMFELLQLSQERYASENQLSGSFQEARLALDQIARDVNDSGYPSLGMFSVIPANAAAYVASPVAWSPSYPTSSCLVGTGGGGTCLTPGDFDLILETTVNGTVSWIRYQLQGTTLNRAVVPKTGGDPWGPTSAAGVMVPFLTNVMNNATGQLAQITATYPLMFPSGQPVPIFQYTCDTSAGPAPCPTAGASNSPANIRDVDITLIVMTQQPDAQTHMLKLVELNGRGHRANPSY